jgi:predicted MFS family arabinose efflux permease
VLARGADELGSFLPIGAFGRLSRDLGIDYGDAGLIFAAMAVGGLAAGPFGVLADHRSRRGLAVLGALGYAAALAGFAVAGSLPVVLVAAALLGASSDELIGACEVALADVAGTRLERELSRSNLCSAVGDVAGPALFVAVGLVGRSWRLALWFGAAAMAAYAAWLATLRFPPPIAGADRDPEGAPAGGHAARTPWRATLHLLTDPAIWWFALVAALFSPLDEPFLGFLVAFLGDHRGVPPQAANAVAAAVVLGGLATYVVLVRRAPGRHALVVAASTLTAASATVAVASWLPVVGAAGFAFGAGSALFWVAYQARLLRLRPGRAGAVTTVVGLLEQPAVLIPAAIGGLADRAGLQAAMLAYAALPVGLVVLTGLAARRGRIGGPERLIAGTGGPVASEVP